MFGLTAGLGPLGPGRRGFHCLLSDLHRMAGPGAVRSAQCSSPADCLPDLSSAGGVFLIISLWLFPRDQCFLSIVGLDRFGGPLLHRILPCGAQSLRRVASCGGSSARRFSRSTPLQRDDRCCVRRRWHARRCGRCRCDSDYISPTERNALGRRLPRSGRASLSGSESIGIALSASDFRTPGRTRRAVPTVSVGFSSTSLPRTSTCARSHTANMCSSTSLSIATTKSSRKMIADREKSPIREAARGRFAHLCRSAARQPSRRHSCARRSGGSFERHARSAGGRASQACATAP